MKFKQLWGNPFFHKNGTSLSDLEFLAKVPVFDTLTRRQKKKIQSLIHIRHFTQGEIVFRQDDPGVGLYIVREGNVSVWREHPDMTKARITDLSTGDFFGEISLLNESPRSATVVAEKQSVLFGFFRSDLLALMDSDPKLGVRLVYQIARIVAERLRLVTDDLSE
ncbi:cyclic nucleotide-binding domain-containing protein [Candidatus Latescibacterota bacterium]